jgi:hypothetical protein
MVKQQIFSSVAVPLLLLSAVLLLVEEKKARPFVEGCPALFGAPAPPKNGGKREKSK